MRQSQIRFQFPADGHKVKLNNVQKIKDIKKSANDNVNSKHQQIRRL